MCFIIYHQPAIPSLPLREPRKKQIALNGIGRIAKKKSSPFFFWYMISLPRTVYNATAIAFNANKLRALHLENKKK